MQTVQERCISAYQKHRHLKRAGEEVGIPWQSVYTHLRNANISVTGDKAVYGSESDKLASVGEGMFKKLVPNAHDNNLDVFQPKIDFTVYGYGVDVKSSRLKLNSSRGKSLRWSFCLKKQETIADFFVCFGFGADSDLPLIVLLIPGEIARKYTTLSLPANGGKWRDYAINPDDLNAFFKGLPEI